MAAAKSPRDPEDDVPGRRSARSHRRTDRRQWTQPHRSREALACRSPERSRCDASVAAVGSAPPRHGRTAPRRHHRRGAPARAADACGTVRGSSPAIAKSARSVIANTNRGPERSAHARRQPGASAADRDAQTACRAPACSSVRNRVDGPAAVELVGRGDERLPAVEQEHCSRGRAISRRPCGRRLALDSRDERGGQFDLLRTGKRAAVRQCRRVRSAAGTKSIACTCNWSGPSAPSAAAHANAVRAVPRPVPGAPISSSDPPASRSHRTGRCACWRGGPPDRCAPTAGTRRRQVPSAPSDSAAGSGASHGRRGGGRSRQVRRLAIARPAVAGLSVGPGWARFAACGASLSSSSTWNGDSALPVAAGCRRWRPAPAAGRADTDVGAPGRPPRQPGSDVRADDVSRFAWHR